MQNTFSHKVLTWFHQHGRKHLPWQRNRNAYNIWVAEIMLQQTRVETVIPYYEEFMYRFPDVRQLAAASTDEVLHHWTGLGYYARARNLHQAARHICTRHAGKFPATFNEVLALPGVGRSTAAAILAFSFQQPHAILDGNVKRILTRYFAIAGWPGDSRVEAQLWQHAEALLPTAQVAAYTQAMMDLGATICTPANPGCLICPLNTNCTAYRQRRQHQLPTPKPTRRLPQREVLVALVQNRDAAVWLEKRPPAGIWGGLYSFPEFTDASGMEKWLQKTWQINFSKATALPAVTHTFSHFRLRMYPQLIQVNKKPNGIMEHGIGVWYKYPIQKPGQKIGLAAPIKNILQQVTQHKKGILA